MENYRVIMFIEKIDGTKSILATDKSDVYFDKCRFDFIVFAQKLSFDEALEVKHILDKRLK